MTKLLKIRNLSISFTQYIKGLNQKELQVITDLSLDIHESEIIAILGASGSGKSLLANAILGILPPNALVSGSIKYKGNELTNQLRKKLKGTKISLIPQSVNYLNPLMIVQEQAIGTTQTQEEKEEKILRQQKIFKEYGLSKDVNQMYPFQLSGGMARKVLISTALLNNPDVIIADEPTPGLDQQAVTETINNLINLKKKKVGMILITHDINTAIRTSDKIAILYLGFVIEITNTKNFKDNGEKLLHPYTKALYNALPETHFKLTKGTQPSYHNIPKGCPYQENCPHKTDKCIKILPELKTINDTQIRCHHPLIKGE
ncbi:MAG: ABC transporter ATP-binding protein [Methanobacteriaceae archaeon]|nr:ABC transporter ATP-binding protein [Methanobacteriaceae archaeon]